MARFTKKADNAEKTTEKKYDVLHSFEILRATQYDWGTVFNMVLNGVTIYNCTVAQTHEGNFFVSFPSRKGSDGKYYAYVRFYFSPEDLEKVLAAVESKL